ncbi:MAG TPA: TonB family protein [Cyclobacteriaceae bacterium]|nr:TonB family protein [Cyclobacteriaceae bacterium]
MEPKKNPAYDVHRYRSTLLPLGLITSIAIVIMAFEWKAKVALPPNPRPETPLEEMVYTVVPTEHVYNSKSVVKPASIPITMIEVTNNATEPSDVIPVEPPAPDDPAALVLPIVDVPVETASDLPVIFAEVMPEPESGYSDFYNLLSRSLRYPKQARQSQTQGKVFVEFIVNEKGVLSDFKIIKGIGRGCDEEAIRVLKLSKWKPGKQRGRPVKVRMVQPITFRLNS